MTLLPQSSQCGSHSSQKERSEDSSAAGKAVCSPSKKRLVLSSVKREEFLRWEDPITSSSPQEEKEEQVEASYV